MLVALCAILAGLSSSTLARTLYVDDDAPGTGDGSSWAAAFKYLHNALTLAKAGDEIRIAQGQYRPDQDGRPTLVGNRKANFRLVDGVAILGGFGGLTEADPNLRDTVHLATVLTGDLAGNDDDPDKEAGLLGDNSFYVVTVKGAVRNVLLDGLTIAHGYGDESTGAGLYNDGGSLTIRDCTFLRNGSGDDGGGIYNSGGTLQIERSRFIGNWSDEGAGALDNRAGSVQVIASEFMGNYSSVDGTGAVDNFRTGNAVFFGCLFRGNVSTDGDGALWNAGELRLRYCTFIDNEGGAGVGAVSSTDGHVVAANCLFVGNTGNSAGAMSIWEDSASLDHCTFYGNVATDGFAGAVYCAPAHLRLGQIVPAASLHASGCIFWANRALDEDGTVRVTGYEAQIKAEPNAATVEYCCIEGWTPERGGLGNIGTDPLFVGPDQNDFHLKSQASHWDGASQAWVLDDVTSPCIDAGDPNRPFEQEPLPNGGRVNMGVYGGTCEASKSWPNTEATATLNAADLNGDGRVDDEDYRLALQRWPQTGQ